MGRGAVHKQFRCARLLDVFLKFEDNSKRLLCKKQAYMSRIEITSFVQVHIQEKSDCPEALTLTGFQQNRVI